ncbi:MAG: hypothetical protein JSU85_01110 [Candidatus Zixiibacteriota bacterium]|nr:MAG: hypothetical protein JSU85_01110 [candidate division Zixibacteria bacterium]
MTKSQEKVIKLIKAFRVDKNQVKVLYRHKELRYEFLVEWNNIRPDNGKVEQYDLMLNVLSEYESFSERVINAIKKGEIDENPDLDLYLEIRDTFDCLDCESLD